MRVGIVPGAFKPYHAGHHKMIEIASRENDVVYVIVSLSDRIRENEPVVTGDQMKDIWNDHLQQILPENAKDNLQLLPPGQTPVRIAYEMLENEAECNSGDVFSIYSDPRDINRYNSKSLLKTLPEEFVKNNVKKRPVGMEETADIRGTDMREWMKTRNKKKFLESLPAVLTENSKEQIWYKLVGPDVKSFPAA